MFGALIPLALQIVGTLTGASSTIGTVVGAGSEIIKMLAGEKAGEVAEKIVRGAEAVFGTADPKQIELLIQQDKSKADLALAQMNNDLEAYRIQVDDIKSARERDVEMRKTTGGANNRANVMLAGNFCCIIVIVIGIIWFRASMPDGIAAILGGLIGNLATMMTQAFNFEFGSSRGSSEKTDQMASMISKMAK